MIRRSIVWLVLTVLVATSSGQNQKGAPVSKQKPQTSFTEKLLKFLGIADSPGTLKGPGDEVISGELWLADLQVKSTRALASDAGYRSPIFWMGSKDILVLRGTEVVRVPSTGEGRKSLYSVQGILKLVGASSEDPTTVLILLRDPTGGRPRVGLLTVSTGAVSPVPYDPASSQDLLMIENLAGWSRTYSNQHVFMQKQHKQALSGIVEWHDVFLQVDGNPPVDVSQCDGVDCVQPSLSPDGHWLVFVRAKAE